MTRVVLVPGVLALLPEYAGIEDPVAELRAAALDAVAWLGRRSACWPTRRAPAWRRTSWRRRTGAATSRRTSWSATVRPCAPRRRPATSTSGRRRSTPRWARRSGPADPAVDVDLARELWASVDAIVELGELDDDLGAAQVDYDDAPYGVQYWVVRWTSDS